MGFASYKDRKSLTAALKEVYRATDVEAAERALSAFEQGPWDLKYPAIGKAWRRVWSEVVPFFAFPEEVRRIIYTTNAIEARNSKLRRAVHARGRFPNDEAASKLLFLVLKKIRRGVENASQRVSHGESPVRSHLRRQVPQGDGRLTM